MRKLIIFVLVFAGLAHAGYLFSYKVTVEGRTCAVLMDPEHRKLFLAFLSKQLAREAKFQTIVFTSLRNDEIDGLRRQGTSVLSPDGRHLLRLMPPSTGKQESKQTE